MLAPPLGKGVSALAGHAICHPMARPSYFNYKVPRLHYQRPRSWKWSRRISMALIKLTKLSVDKYHIISLWRDSASQAVSTDFVCTRTIIKLPVALQITSPSPVRVPVISKG